MSRRIVAVVASALVLIGAGFVSAPVAAAETNVSTPTELRDAFNSATGDDNLIRLVDSFTVPASGPTIAVSSGVSVTLDLNGHRLTSRGLGDESGVGVPAGATLIIDDSAGGGVLHAMGGVVAAGIGGGYTGSGGTVIINDGTVNVRSFNGAGIGGGSRGGGADVVIGVGAEVTAASTLGSAVGAGVDGTGFGSLSNAGELRIRSTLRIPGGVTVPNWGTLTGAGEVENSGAIVNTGSVNTTGGLVVSGNNYLLEFDPNGGSGAPDALRVYAPTLGAAELELPAQEPTREGHVFTGWYLEGSGARVTTSTQLGTGGGPTSVGLSAGWEANEYTVAFETGEGSAVPDQTVPHGETVSAPDEPTRVGYGFAGWYTAPDGGGQEWDFSTPVTGDLVLHAAWEPQLNELVLAPSDSVVEAGETVTFEVTGQGPGGERVDVSAASLSSSVDGDEIEGWTVAATTAGEHAITAELDGVAATATLTVTPAEPATLDLWVGGGQTQVPEGGSVTFGVSAADEFGNPVDASGVELSSSVATDVIEGLTVEFPTASPHTITARLGALSDSVTIDVVPPRAADPTDPGGESQAGSTPSAGLLPAVGAEAGLVAALTLAGLLLLTGSALLLRPTRRTRTS